MDIPVMKPITSAVTPFSDPGLLDAIERYEQEALAKLVAYKRVTCQAETFDRALALLDLCRGQVDEELAAEITKLLTRE